MIERFHEIKYKPIIGDAYNDLLANDTGRVQITLTIVTPRGKSHRYIAEEMFPTYNAEKIGEPVLLVEKSSEKLWQYLCDMWKEGAAIYLGTLAAVGATIDTVEKHIVVEIVKGEPRWFLNLGYFDIIFLFLIGAIPSLVYLLTAHKGINKNNGIKTEQNGNGPAIGKRSPL